MFCATICSAQTATVKEALPDGSFIVVINGEELRTVNAAKAREIQERKIKLEAAEAKLIVDAKTIAELNNQIELMIRDVNLAQSQTQTLAERSAKFEELYTAEKELRLAAEKLIGRRSRTTEFFEHPAVQIIFKAAVPVISAFRK